MHYLVKSIKDLLRILVRHGFPLLSPTHRASEDKKQIFKSYNAQFAITFAAFLGFEVDGVYGMEEGINEVKE